MSIETTTVYIRGATYTIKRYTFDEVSALAEITDKRVSQKTSIMMATVDPKFASIEEVGALDHETVMRLSHEIQKFNTVDADFLSDLKNSYSLAQRLEKEQIPVNG